MFDDTLRAHIKAICEDNKAWCGETLSDINFHFKDAEHAAMNGRTGGVIKSCDLCAISVIRNLVK